MKQKIKFIAMVFGVTTSFITSLNVNAQRSSTTTIAADDGDNETLYCFMSATNICGQANGKDVKGTKAK